MIKPSLAFAVCICVSGCDDPRSTEPTPAPQAPSPAAPIPPAPGSPVDPQEPAVAPPPPGEPAFEVPPKLVLDPSPPTLAPVDEATKAKAAQLASQLDGRSFAYDVESDSSNARAFLHLAHTAEDPRTVAAALHGMATAYGATQRHGARLVDADYHAVVAHRLASSDPAIATAAFEASHASMKLAIPHAAVMAVLVDRAHHHESLTGRYLALEALGEAETATGPVQKAFMHALHDPSPSFVALALEAMGGKGDDFADRPALHARLTTLLGSPDAGVRGEAAQAILAIARDELERAEIAKRLTPLLDDPHPFPRGAATMAMGRLRHTPAAAKVAALLDDLEPPTFRVERWAHLDGTASAKKLQVSYGESVAAAALLSLSLLSTTTSADFSYAEDIVYDSSGRADYGAAIAKAKAWYAANAHLFPSE